LLRDLFTGTMSFTAEMISRHLSFPRGEPHIGGVPLGSIVTQYELESFFTMVHNKLLNAHQSNRRDCHDQIWMLLNFEI
jgi:hypothetical protein